MTDSTHSVNISRLCSEARCACMMAGLHPSCWRWSYETLRCFKYEISQHCTLKIEAMMMPLPKGAIYIYEGLPVYPMIGLTNALAVACIGTKKKKP
jgi:hypothetical protein